MCSEMPMLPNICIPSCDVRDVAQAHLKAMILPEAANNRHLIVSSYEKSFKDWALILKSEFESKNYKIPTIVAPNFAVKLFSIFDKTLKLVSLIYFYLFLDLY
jgi:dihydroflavonol-4-reductase